MKKRAAAATTRVAMRLPDSLLERLDEFAERMRTVQPGVSVSRTDAVRLLLTRAMDDASEPEPRKPAKRPNR